MTREDVMKSYIPEYLRTSQVITSILDAEEAELDQVNGTIEDILLQFYVETTAEAGLLLWEQFLGLTSYTNKPLNQRRSRIISKLRGIGTINAALIQNVAESYIYGHVDVTEHPEIYSFTVKFIDPYGVPPNLADIKAAVEEIKPAHLAAEYQFTFTAWGEVKNITWGEVNAGAWEDLKTRQIV